MASKSLADQAAALAARTHKFKDPLVVDRIESHDPKTQKPIYRFRVVSAANANAASYDITLNHEGEPVEATPAIDKLFDRSGFTTSPTGGPAAGPAGGPPPITISPTTNDLTLNPSDTFDETITVTIPKSAGPAKA